MIGIKLTVMLIIFLFICMFLGQMQPLQIALHAQVFPVKNRTIVGSVITTDGLKAALLKRSEITKVVIFYPFEYAEIPNHKWDLIIIEGWFPMINHFIHLSRNHAQDAVIIFYCLDPTYPSLDVTTSLDVDGYMTNSRPLREHLSEYAPTVFLMLAADEEKMKPIESISKEYTGVYVGAGGPMLEYKPVLVSLLEETAPFGLYIYGSAWDMVPSVSTYWKGTLSKDDIAVAYAKAEIVIASTIESQAIHGMINNRIFEALSCGSVVISDYFEELAYEFRDVLMIVNETKQASKLIRSAMESPSFAMKLRLKGRQFILKKHTWSHRVIEILDFYGSIIQRRRFNGWTKSHVRSNTPKLAWIVSSNLLLHPDYQFGISSSLWYFTKIFDVHHIDEYTWMTNSTDNAWLSSFDVIISVVILFDGLDKTFQKLPRLKVEGKDEIQRRASFIIGFVSEDYGELVDMELLHYDVIWYRSPFELKSLELLGFRIPGIRMQHSFGTIESSKPVDFFDNDGTDFERLYQVLHSSKDEILEVEEMNVVDDNRFENWSHAIICTYNYMSSCTSIKRQGIEETHSVLVLLGGTLNAWISDDRFLGSTPLTRIILSGNYSSDLVISVLKIVREVTVMYDIRSDDFRDIHFDTLWPFVYPLTLGKMVNVKDTNRHIESIMDSNCKDWNGRYMENSLKIGIARLFGLGVATSKFNMKVLKSDMTITSAYIHLEIEFIDFEPGRDGKFCVVYKSIDVICIIRPLAAIILRLSQKNGLVKNLRSQIKLMFECRGNMFNNKIYVEEVKFYVDIPLKESSVEFNEVMHHNSSEAFLVDVVL